MDGRPSQRAKFFLRSWQYYERHINELRESEKEVAAVFFTCLKKMQPTDIDLLAERYYKSKVPTSFSSLVGDYTGVKPVSFEVIASKLGKSPIQIQRKLHLIETRLGSLIIAEKNRRNSAKNLIKPQFLEILEMFPDPEERSIIRKALKEIELLQQSG